MNILKLDMYTDNNNSLIPLWFNKFNFHGSDADIRCAHYLILSSIKVYDTYFTISLSNKMCKL